jgi:hypothetical protein
LLIFSNILHSQKSIILKIKPQYKQFCYLNSIELPSFQQIFKDKSLKIKQLFPNAYFPDDTNDIFYKYCVDISTIYELYAETDAEKLTKQISALPEVEYCHIKQVPELLYYPNDPAIGAQYYLNNLKAFEAWDIYKGDSTVVIGIVDTGTELAHDDLWQNIAYNWNDIIDGIDNDGDGFVDNFHGWDIGNNDNSPEWSENAIGANPHGVFVAGMAAPKTDNGIGIAGVGFKTKYLPVKISDSTGILSRSYEGVVYAADHGCKIINCSWGSTISDEFGYDVIKYATYNRKSLVIAAAGNKGNTTNDIYYPAAYNEVVCVAATNSADVKWNKSCYGYHVDVSAPGENVYSTYSNNGYTYGWGTSYASPLVASVAALTYGYYQKKLNPFQLRAIIENTADNIDTIQDNIPFANQIGKGRVNALKALTISPNKAVYAFNFTTSEHNDTGTISFSIINLFKATDHLYIKIQSNSAYIHFINDSLFLGSLDSLQIVNNNQINFNFIINSTTPFDYAVDFFIYAFDNNLTNKFHFKSFINKSYTNINNENIKMTVCSNGKIGYNSLSPSQGIGIQYINNISLTSETGVFLLNGNKASWCFSGKKDFKTINKVYINDNSEKLSSYALFNDSLNNNPLNVEIKQNITLFKTDSLSHFSLINYKIYNKSHNKLDSLHFGLFSDIDILNPNLNKVEYDNFNNIIYASYPYSIYTHVGFLLPENFNKFFYAIDNDGRNGSINILDGININEIRQMSSQNRLEAGIPDGNDVSVAVSYGPITINANDSISLNFIMVFGRNFQELINNAEFAKSLFDTTINIQSNLINDVLIYPNPSRDYIIIKLNNNNYAKVKIYNSLGKCLIESEFISNPFVIKHNLSKGVYFVEILTENYVLCKKLIVE